MPKPDFENMTPVELATNGTSRGMRRDTRHIRLVGQMTSAQGDMIMHLAIDSIYTDEILMFPTIIDVSKQLLPILLQKYLLAPTFGGPIHFQDADVYD